MVVFIVMPLKINRLVHGWKQHNEIKEPLKNETSKSDQSATNSYVKEINILKEEVNKKEVLIKDLVETIKSLTKNSLKQQSIQS